MKKRQVLLFFCVLLMVLASSSWATVHFDVDFETGYTNGGLVGQSGGVMGDGVDDVWLSGGVSSNLTTVQGTIALDTKAVETYRSGFGGANARMDTRINWASSEPILYQMSMYASEPASKGWTVITNHLSGQIQLAGGRNGSGNFEYWYQPSGSTTQYVDSGFALAEDTWYDVEFQISDGSPDKLDIWVGTGGSWTEVAPDLDFSPANSQMTNFWINPQGSGTANVMYFDNLYAGTGADAPFVPEPATMALLAIGGMIAVRRRK